MSQHSVEKSKALVVPLLPLRDIVIFPHRVVPLFIGRDRSIRAIESAMEKDRKILFALQKDAKVNDPKEGEIYPIGTLGTAIQCLKLPDGTVKVLVEGERRGGILRFIPNEPFYQVEVAEVETPYQMTLELEALMRSVRKTFETYGKLNQRITPEMMASMKGINDPNRLADTMVVHLGLKLEDKQRLLEIRSPERRLEELYKLLQLEIEILQVEQKIRARVKKQMEKAQKEYYLSEQMRAIQKELGEKDDVATEMKELEFRIRKKRMSKEATQKVEKEFKKLKLIPPMSAEATVVRNYIDWFLSLPWGHGTKDKLDLKRAEEILDEEVIRIVGYTEPEKIQIAQKFLVPKQMKANGLTQENIHFSDGALRKLIQSYTREAGVRNLEREIASICRKVAKKVLREGKNVSVKVTSEGVQKFLGVPKFRYGKGEDQDQVGLANGLAWTEVGGELLITEVTIMPGKGNLIITGKLGDVMQESAHAAMSYVRSRANRFGLEKNFYQKLGTHIHIPEGAIPKDGPSAGITMATAITSALLKIPVRSDLAMTGEITLRGRVLPVGGLKEKILATHRAGIKTVLIPKDNEKDLKEIPPKILKSVELVRVEHMDKVLRRALVLDAPEHFLVPKVEELPTPQMEITTGMMA